MPVPPVPGWFDEPLAADRAPGPAERMPVPCVPEGFDLAVELADRLATAPAYAAFDLVVALGEPDDPTDYPTAIWPERPRVVAGRLQVESVSQERGPVIFDPTNVTEGLSLPDDDEILRLRRATYGLSYSARTSD